MPLSDLCLTPSCIIQINLSSSKVILVYLFAHRTSPFTYLFPCSATSVEEENRGMIAQWIYKSKRLLKHFILRPAHSSSKKTLQCMCWSWEETVVAASVGKGCNIPVLSDMRLGMSCKHHQQWDLCLSVISATLASVGSIVRSRHLSYHLSWAFPL